MEIECRTTTEAEQAIKDGNTPVLLGDFARGFDCDNQPK